MTDPKPNGMTDYAVTNAALKKLLDMQVQNYLTWLDQSTAVNPIFYLSSLECIYEAVKLRPFPPTIHSQLNCLDGRRLSSLREEEFQLLKTICTALLKGDV